MKSIIFLSLVLCSFGTLSQQTEENCFKLDGNGNIERVHICNDLKREYCNCEALSQETDYFYTAEVYYFYNSYDSLGVEIVPSGDWDTANIGVNFIGPFVSYDVNDPLEYSTIHDSLRTSIFVTGGDSINTILPEVAGYYFISPVAYGYLDSGTCPVIDINFSKPSVCRLDTTLPCETCIGSFAPIQGEKYLVSAWAKESGALPTTTTYTKPELSIVCDTGSGTATFGPFNPSGQIIDGWQRIEEEFTIPTNATNIQVLLESTSGDVYFDDVRFFPFNASMKSYVYDPVNMRLSAELDERHFATFYEYDEEGKLKRIKKETEKGVMTIQETKSNSAK